MRGAYNQALRLKLLKSLKIRPIYPYSFEHTVRKFTKFGIDWFWFTPFEVFKDGILWTASILEGSDRAAGFKLWSSGNMVSSIVNVQIYLPNGYSTEEASQAEKMIRRCLCCEEDVSDFYRMGESYPFLRKAIADLYGMRLTQFPNLFDAIILALTLQRATYGRTEKMIRLLSHNYGMKVLFDNMLITTLPSAVHMSKVEEEELRKTCKLGYRARYLRAAAQAIRLGKLPPMETLNSMPFQEAINTLTQIKGIGTYSIEVICAHPAFPVDSWSAKYFCHLFGIETTRKDGSSDILSKVKQYAEKNFGIFQRYAYEYLINDMENLALSGI